MESKTFKVPNIGCNGCVSTIVSELKTLDGVKQVEGSVDTKQVTVTWDSPATWEQIVSTLTEIEYAPEA
jgi:copper chaperone CopZ